MRMSRENLENEMVKVGVSQEDLESSILALGRLKAVLSESLVKTNLGGLGLQHAAKLEREFDRAIDAMTLLLLQFPDYQD